MPECRILGMELDIEADHPLRNCTPLSGVTIIKMLDADGAICYTACSTSDLTTVECLGMIEYARTIIRSGMMTGCDDDD